MRSTMTRRGLLVVFGAVAFTLVVAAVGWACTWPVGSTTTGDASAVSTNLTGVGQDLDNDGHNDPDGNAVAVLGGELAAEGEVWHNASGSQFYLSRGSYSGGGTGGSSFFGEDGSPCGDDSDPDDAECLYDLGLVNPIDYQQEGHSDTCHYETPESFEFDSSTGDIEFAVIDDSPEHQSVPGQPTRLLAGQGTIPANDAGGKAMGTGETVMCFYSSETADSDGSPLNGRNDGAAAATLPQPVIVLN